MPAPAEIRPPRGWWPYALLIFLAAAVFAQTLRFDFIDYDDGNIIFEHPQVLQGLTWQGVQWAFTHPHHYLYMPVTSLTHMLDVSLWGLWPGGHHLSSVVYHALAGCLLYAALVALTRHPWASLFIAALFVVHPLRANSVAWLSTRKDPVSAIFFFSMLWAYARYARRPSAMGYAAVAAPFVLGMLAKPILMSAPLVLLLLDFWPLKRLRTEWPALRQQWPVLLEKLPLLALSGISVVVTVLAQRMDDERLYAGAVPLARRAGDMLLNYVYWLEYFFLPIQLAIHYPPHADGFAWWKAALAAVLLLGITALCLWQHRRPWLLIGWLWYLIILFPNSGIVRYGHAAFELRYTYLPLIGITLALTFLCLEYRRAPRVLAGVAVLIICVYAALGAWQVSYWRNTETVFSRAAAVTSQNDLAYKKLGQLKLEAGDAAGAVALYQQAVTADPANGDAYLDLGRAHLAAGQHQQAAEQFALVVRNQPNDAYANALLGEAALRMKSYPLAIMALEKALAHSPGSATVWVYYGAALTGDNRADRAHAAWQRARDHMQDNAQALQDAAHRLHELGFTGDANPFAAHLQSGV